MKAHHHARRLFATASIVALCAVGVTVGSASTAYAGVTYSPSSTATLILSNDSTSSPKPAGVSPDVTAPTSGDGTYTVHSASSSASQHISNSFSTKVAISNAYTYVKILSGTATTTWTGSGSGTVDIDNHYWVTGLAVSVSVPAGASGSIFNEAVDYRGHQTKSTKTTDTNSGAVWSGPIFTFNENMTGSWSVSGNSYHLTTN